ncbi:hypothetical protein ACFWUU_23895 [Kribbella sp. NPDC058693]|uniref:hypothetical protein n=1 Tax=Kribbella sp. NPDC058693 TaxID=3346602 RepID=UPI00365C9110
MTRIELAHNLSSASSTHGCKALRKSAFVEAGLERVAMSDGIRRCSLAGKLRLQ